MRMEQAFLRFRDTIPAPIDLHELGQFALTDGKIVVERSKAMPSHTFESMTRANAYCILNTKIIRHWRNLQVDQ